MFKPIRTVTLQKLESLAASIARKIGLDLLSVNFHAIASRYLKHLSLPVEKILPHACQVYEWSMPPELYLSDNDSRLPSRVCVMSILIVTMTILYDLNGGKWELIASCSNNLVSAVENGAGECGFSCNAREFSKDLHSYLPYCKDVVFAGLGPAYDDHEVKKLIEVFWDSYQSRKAGKASEDGKTRHGCSSTPKESENFRDDACKCKCKYKMSRDDGDSNVTLRQMKADMKENRFVYIPPRKNVKKKDGYIRYARKKDGAYLYAVHADYYIILRSCAKVAQVDVRTMHVGVLAFE
ncbi:TATA box-binding protein-associated factor RNA polymerase I subunit B-like [Solanum stenotomum]|uniref:TATA box-binding protein-associated factor RNA polymerase I subunit B-like n=1 Tax=Solanum stenotomum TaxID=172797 RepID=UPI0020D1D243|nr:TATA box-binding protein-associated factor RNA polymerase I subunit B-like [Solanum stenotomum]